MFRYRYIRFPLLLLLAIFSGMPATATEMSLDEAWKALPKYEYGGQDMAALLTIDREVIRRMVSPDKLSACAARLASVLEAADTTLAVKQYICCQLRQVGTPAEVPILARMLADPKTSHLARYALESIPGEESLAALRGSLDFLHGDLLVGAINSVAARKDVKAVAKLKDLAVGKDAIISGSAFWALGNIADLESIAFVVEKARKAESPLTLKRAVPLLRVTEAITSAGNTDRVMSIYEKLAATGQPAGIRRAALATVLEKNKGRRTETILAWISGSDADCRVVAASHLAKLSEPELDSLTAKISVLSDDSRLGLVEVLIMRKGKDTLPLVLPLVQSDNAEIKLAGIRMLGQIGDPATIASLTDCLAADNEITAAARQSLCMLPRKAMLAALVKHPEIRLAVLEVLKQLKYYEAINPLVDIAAKDDAATYEPALAAFAEIADPDEHDLPRLLKLLPATQGKHRKEVERTIFIVCQKSPATDCTEPLMKILDKVDAAEMTLYLPLLGRFGGDKVLEIIDTYLADKNPQTQKAVVRALCNWPNAEVADRLWAIASDNGDSQQFLRQALCAYVCVVTLKSDRPEAETLSMLQKSMKAAATLEDRHWIIQRASTVQTLETVLWIAQYLDDAEANQAACRSIVELAHHRFLRHPNMDKFGPLLEKVGRISKRSQRGGTRRKVSTRPIATAHNKYSGTTPQSIMPA